MKISNIAFMAIVFFSLLAFQTDAKCNEQSTKVQIHTMGDLLKKFGVSDSSARKYIEDETKQYLQDEISKIVDTKLDVTVYLQTLNHFAHGETKKANTYLAQETLKKILENLIGSGPMTVLTTSWNFTSFVWKSVQKWAEDKDMDLYKKFLLKHTSQWDRGRDLWEIEKGGSKRVFDLWWNDNYLSKIGKTKMYKDREVYYKKFKNDCLNNFMRVAQSYVQIGIARKMLEENAKTRQYFIFEHLNKIYTRYNNAVAQLKYAKQSGNMSELVKKYYADSSFRKHIADLISKRKKDFVVEDSKILNSAKENIETVKVSMSKFSKIFKDIRENHVKYDSKGNADVPIVKLSLEPYQNFLSDYENLTSYLFSSSLSGMAQSFSSSYENGYNPIKTPLLQWYKNFNEYNNKVMHIRNFYDQVLHGWIISKSKRDAIQKEVKEIDGASKSFHEKLLNTMRHRENQAVESILSFGGQITKLEHLASNSDSLNKKVLKKYREKEKKFRKNIEKNFKRYLKEYGNLATVFIHYKAPNVIIRSRNPLIKMHEYSMMFKDYLSANEKFYSKMRENIPKLIEKSDEQQIKKTIAKNNYAELTKPYIASWLYLLASSRMGYRTNIKIPKLNFMPGYWNFKYGRSIQTANRIRVQLNNIISRGNLKLFNLYGYGEKMREDFSREKRLYEEAKTLFEELKTLTKRYSKIDDKTSFKCSSQVATWYLQYSDIQRKSLEKSFSQMIYKNHFIMNLAKSNSPKYALSEGSSYALNHFPYQALRRNLQENRKIIQDMHSCIKNYKSGSSNDLIKKMRDDLGKIDAIRFKTKLTYSLVDKIYNMSNSLVQKSLRKNGKNRKFDIVGANEVLKIFNNFSNAVEKNYHDDNLMIKNYFEQVQSFLYIDKNLDKVGCAKNLWRAIDILNKINSYKDVVDNFALYRANWKYGEKIKTFENKIDKLMSICENSTNISFSEATSKIQSFYRQFKEAYESKDVSSVVSLLSDDWGSSSDGTDMSDLEDYLSRSFRLFDSIIYNISNLNIQKIKGNLYRVSYNLSIEGEIYDEDIVHVEKSSVQEEVQVKNGTVKILKTLNGQYWSIK